MANFHEFDFAATSQRPFHDLLAALPHLAVTDGKADLAASSTETLQQIAENAEAAMRTAHNGMNAMGHLLALASSEVDDGNLTAPAIEAFGWLLAELADLAATCDVLAASCRKQLACAKRKARVKR
jgi:hypothetical protein